jgi:carbon-monoxide dehydrogenase medium subunit
VDKAKQIITEAAIALGPVAPTPFRSKRIEDAIKGMPATLQTLQEAADRASAYCSPRDSLLRGSCDYRQEMVKALVKRGLRRALEQAGCTL